MDRETNTKKLSAIDVCLKWPERTLYYVYKYT